MSDALTLRNLLRNADMTAPAIQGTAGAMMKHYDRSPGVAVNEWRNALHQARLDQHLPLLYVANETLQNSKRNRGNKFLEAFSPTLGQSLAFICQKNPGVVEKVRRTVKIWGDRHVFSIRFVNELLKGLEAFRNDNGYVPPSPEPEPVPAPSLPAVAPVTFSPLSQPPRKERPKPVAPTPAPFDIDKEMASSEDDDNDASSVEGSVEGMDEDNIFGDAANRLLDIELDLDKAAAAAKKSAANSRKRPRPTSGGASGRPKRRHSILSTDKLMDLWNQISSLQNRFDNTQTILGGIPEDYLDESKVVEQIDTLVGDELVEEYKKAVLMEKRVVEQRKALHEIASKRKALEKDATRYLPWLETALKQDEEEIEFCERVKQQLLEYQTLQELVKVARDKRVEEEERKQLENEKLERQKKEEEERKKFMEEATHKNMEAKPGMVWNREAGEYQYLNTDDSWRDN